MTTTARNLYADLVAIPWGFWLALALVAVGGYYLARWSDPFDPYAHRPGYLDESDAEYRQAGDGR